MIMKLVLATKSQSVAKALYDAGYDFEVKPVILCTDTPKNVQPGIIAMGLALEQLSAAVSCSNAGDFTAVVSIETLMVCEDEIIDLPKDRNGDDSPSRLKTCLVRYATYPVRIYTAVAVKNLHNNKRVGDYAVTEMTLHPFTQSEMNALVLDPDCYQCLGGLAFNSSNPKTRKLLHKHLATVEGELKNFTHAPVALVRQLLNNVDYSVSADS